ncbi:MAG: hypothetical protein CVU34_12295 [Betaproteobacteria bacterium HGW-Betaproteobacteria-7]|nr:MAG: hypothetical protein CVU34_12295 [Betaproteobacteria bacterium HGW-Betaproteobacteria-7]
MLSGAGLSQLGNNTLETADAERKIAADSEIISILSDEVMTLTYRTEALTLTAQRSKPADQFAVQITFADGRKPRQCLASPDLGGLLTSLSTFTAKGQIQVPQFDAEFPRMLGTLEIRDRIDTAPPPAMVFRTTADKMAVALSYDGHAAEVGTSIDEFAKLEGGCETLAQR